MDPAVRDAVDIALGAGVAATTLGGHRRPAVRHGSGRRPAAGRPDHRQRPHTGLAQQLADRGETFREGLERAAAEVVRWILPRAVDRALATIDVTDLVRAHVDLDALAKFLDVDAVVARVDLDAAVARVDLDAVVSRVDLDAVTSRLDLDAVVARVDLDAVASRLDLDAIIDRADLDRAVSRVDLGAIVARVDPDEIVARVDIEAALRRLDLAGIARQVIEAIDLAEILRESAGVVSSQAARVRPYREHARRRLGVPLLRPGAPPHRIRAAR